jgi:hypothetical protein
MGRTGVVLAAVAAALAVSPAASASTIVARNATGAVLRVSGGRALVSYRSGGSERHAIAWGAINARQPNPRIPQVAFHLQYGYGADRGGACLPYTGPPLVLLVAACDAPDGSYWALQSWQRLLPDYGGTHGAWELHLSHWSGPLPQLEVWEDWVYGGRFQHLFGRFTYRGQGVYGFRSTPRGNPLDAYGRNLYLDTFDSAYGHGWHRENGFLAHKPTGTFCYGFFPHGSHPIGAGKAYRLTVEGPGVTPIVSWSAPSPGPYNRAEDEKLNAIERSLGDPACRQS